VFFVVVVVSPPPDDFFASSSPLTLTRMTAGFRGILSFGWYLDHLSSSWESMYQVEPIDKTLGPESAKRVLGGEACMWGESVDEYNIESRIWPRASAVAERLWSAKDVTSIPDAQQRLHDQRCRNLARGIRVEPFQPGWCY
jgi:hexosaminidase